ncbi:hypothetical protein NEA10_06830 [Phormidium yuhuli AB48]|uniref:Crp/Fnr family transcriptional regulator n=1 Tax=Phormidium yuhuli AB48 TaxID=2940671 RepID=A0ABY5AVT3_9CYAN|nr:hypothetical protein [Phormidium yuhuli]USR92426.1 hypothetical protein NEA10_06830 [Phormidium yuhuli AB48]
MSRSLVKSSQPAELISQLNSGQLLAVDSRRRNGLIIYKRYHAEFAGPGAAVGGFFDVGTQRTIPVGDLALVAPEEYEERQKAYSIRRHWIRLTEQLTENPVPLQRAKMLLAQFEHYFDAETVNSLPDDALASLVGVLPSTIKMVRHPKRFQPRELRAMARV